MLTKIYQNSEKEVEGEEVKLKKQCRIRHRKNIWGKIVYYLKTVGFDEPATNLAEKSLEKFSFEKTLERLQNFKPKQLVKPSSQFPD